MKVAFLHVRQDKSLPLIMLESVRKHLGVPTIQMSDKDEPALGRGLVQRLPWDGKNLMEYRLRHLAALPAGDTIILDTDVVLQADIGKVFAFPFDLALTVRDKPILDPQGVDLAQVMPYNTGVMFSRSRAFWEGCRHWLLQQSQRALDWYGDQMAVAALAADYNVLKLHCDNFNYSPETEDEDVSRRLVVHYKGERRKGWMLNR
jgi:hypothetical protein